MRRRDSRRRRRIAEWVAATMTAYTNATTTTPRVAASSVAGIDGAGTSYLAMLPRPSCRAPDGPPAQRRFLEDLGGPFTRGDITAPRLPIGDRDHGRVTDDADAPDDERREAFHAHLAEVGRRV